MTSTAQQNAVADAPEAEPSHDVVMPRISKSVEHASVTRWFVTEGQAVGEGDVLAEIAADNVTMEIEAGSGGVVAELVVPAGSDLHAAGTLLARLADPAVAAEGSVAPAADATEISVTPPAVFPEPDENLTRPATSLSFAHALRAGLAAQMRQDPNVFVIGESVAEFARCSAVVAGLAEEFGQRRVVGTPITPHAVVGMAVGAAMAGLKPVVEVTAWALALQAMDPIVSSAAKTRYRSNGRQGVPIVLRGRNGMWPGAGAMHSLSLASWFAAVPGLKVVCPATSACAKGLMWSAIADPDPVIILEADALYDTTGPTPDDDRWSVPIGKARIARPGETLTIVTYGCGVALALDAAEALAVSGVSAEVIDLRSLRPLDMPSILTSVRKTGRLLTLDDAPPACSIGAEICAAVTAAAFSSLKAAPVRMAAAETPVPYAANLEALVLPAADDIAAKALRLAGQDRV